MRGQQLGEPENLRCLSAPEVAARHGFRDGTAVTNALQGVGKRHAQDSTVDAWSGDSRETGGDIVGTNERTRGIVDGNQIRRIGRQGLQPIQDRLLPAATTRYRRGQVEAAGGLAVGGIVARRDDDPQSGDPGNATEGEQGAAQDRNAVQEGILLGQRAAKAASPAGRDNQGDAGRHEA